MTTHSLGFKHCGFATVSHESGGGGSNFVHTDSGGSVSAVAECEQDFDCEAVWIKQTARVQFFHLTLEQANDVGVQLRRVNYARTQCPRQRSEGHRKRHYVEFRVSHLRDMLETVVQEFRLEVGSDLFKLRVIGNRQLSTIQGTVDIEVTIADDPT